MFKEVLDSLKSELKNRITSSLYGTYIIFWLIFHHKFIFALFFTSESVIWDTTHVFKSEYLSKLFFDPSDYWSYINWFVPIILTWVFIELFPRYVTIPLFRTEQSYETEKKKIQLEEQRKLEIEDTKLQEESSKKTEATIKKVQKEKEVEKLDPTISWSKEYQEFRGSIYFREFAFVIKSVYEHGGDLSWWNENGNQTRVPQGVLAYSHTNDLLNFKSSKDGKSIELTDKGKFFVRQFSLENRL